MRVSHLRIDASDSSFSPSKWRVRRRGTRIFLRIKQNTPSGGHIHLKSQGGLSTRVGGSHKSRWKDQSE